MSFNFSTFFSLHQTMAKPESISVGDNLIFVNPIESFVFQVLPVLSEQEHLLHSHGRLS